MDIPFLDGDYTWVESRSRSALTLRLRGLIPAMQRRAELHDADASFPADDILALHEAGAMTAPLPPELGGLGIGVEPEAALDCLDVLRAVGAGNLAVGRVYEGHVNALRLITLHGTPAQRERAAADAADGHLFAVWNTDDRAAPLAFDATRAPSPRPTPEMGGGAGLPSPLSSREGLGEGVLRGAKTLCSAVGFSTRPIVTAPALGGVQMILPRLSPGERADASAWTSQGMRGTATGRVDLDGFALTEFDLIGAPGDYLRQPGFSGGAWRASAVAFGGLESLLDAFRAHLIETGRGDDPHQSVRVGQAAIARETARLWLCNAATVAERGDGLAEDVVAYVNMARLAVEAACLDAMRLVTRGVGLAGFMRPHPVERIGRDLATYLRQPMPDAALMQAAARVLAVGELDLGP